MNTGARQHGFTLIELLIAVSLFGLLLALAIPMYTNLISSSQVRNAAEGMLNGVYAAQSAAVGSNNPAQLIVSPGNGTTAGTGWQIQFVNPDNSIPGQRPVPPAPYLLAESAPQATVTPTPIGATELTFDAFGRIIPNLSVATGLPDGTQTISCIKVTNPSDAGARVLTVVVSNTFQATASKLCDPAAAPTEPQACPAAACQ